MRIEKLEHFGATEMMEGKHRRGSEHNKKRYIGRTKKLRKSSDVRRVTDALNVKVD